MSETDAEKTARILNAGWGWPMNAKKAHFYAEGEIISICGKWLYTGMRDGSDLSSPDDCAVCTRKKART